MEAELQQELAKYMDKLAAGLDQVGDFASEQVPLVIQEYLSWQFCHGVFVMSIGMFIVLVSVTCLFGLIRLAKSVKNEPDVMGVVFLMVIAIGFFTLGVGKVYGGAKTCVKVKVAPRVVVIDWIKQESSMMTKGE